MKTTHIDYDGNTFAVDYDYEAPFGKSPDPREEPYFKVISIKAEDSEVDLTDYLTKETFEAISQITWEKVSQ